MSDGTSAAGESIISLDAAADQGTADKGAADEKAATGDKSIIDTAAVAKGTDDAAKTEATKADAAKVAAAKLEEAAAKLELKLPDGLDAKHPSVAQLRKVAAEYGLDSPKAQRFLDLHQEGLKAALDSADQARAKAGEEWVTNQRKEWRTELRNDKDFGGANFEKNSVAANRAWQKYGATPGLKDFLSQGAIDHPAINKLLAAIGHDLGEDTTAVTKAGATARAPADLQKMFDKSPELFT